MKPICLVRRAVSVAALLAVSIGLPLGPSLAHDDRRLAVVAPWDINGLDPAQSGYVFTRMQITETLVTTDPSNQLVPSLAESWTVSDDRLTWRFVLRKGALFHDGSPVTAASVVQSLERARGGASNVLANVPITEIRAAGDDVIVVTDRPFLSLPAFLAHSSTLILAPASFDQTGAVTAIIGTGPYRTTLVEAPGRLEAGRFEDWWGQRPAIAKTSYLASHRGEARTVLAESGQADLVFTLAPEAIEPLRRSDRVNVFVMAIPRTRTLKLNAALPQLADPRARQALSLAIDRAGIAKAILRSPESAATQLFSPALAGWHGPDLPPLVHDPEKARDLLTQAGWVPGPDGIRTRQGEPFKLVLRTYSSRPDLPIIAAALQDQFRTVGVAIEISIVNSGEIPAGHKDGSLELALVARNFSLVPDPLGTLLQDFGPEGGDWGAMNWADNRLVEALGALGSTADPAERKALRQQVIETLQTALPVIPIAWYDHAVAASTRLDGVTVDPLELSYRISGMRWAE